MSSLSSLECSARSARDDAYGLQRLGNRKAADAAWRRVYSLENAIMAHPDYVHLGER